MNKNDTDWKTFDDRSRHLLTLLTAKIHINKIGEKKLYITKHVRLVWFLLDTYLGASIPTLTSFRSELIHGTNLETCEPRNYYILTRRFSTISTHKLAVSCLSIEPDLHISPSPKNHICYIDLNLTLESALCLGKDLFQYKIYFGTRI